MKVTLLALVATVCLTFPALAASINGTWTVDQPVPSGGRGGSMDLSTYVFKVSDTTLTGSIERPGSLNHLVQIVDGTINGDSFHFTATQQGLGGVVYKLSYTGKVVGDRIQLTIKNGEQGHTVQLVRGDYRY